MAKITDYPPGPGLTGAELFLCAPFQAALVNYTYTTADFRTYMGLGTVAGLNYPGGTTLFLRADGTWVVPPGGGGATWGAISGTLSAQTDLQSALNAKLTGTFPGGTTTFLRADGSFAAPEASAAWGSISGTLSAQTDLQTALNLKANLASPTFAGTVAGITATMVGLGSVTNNAQLRSPGAVTSGRTVVFSGTTGEVVAQSTRLEADLVAGPASAVTARIATFNGTGGKTLQDGGQTIAEVIAAAKATTLTSFSAAYPVVLADANTILFHPSSDATPRTVTLPANGTIPIPVGSLITIDNQIGAGALTVAITTDTLEWVGTGATGSRTIAAGGQATVLKVTTTRWRLSGVGVT
jgi:hypothetical protein